MRARGSRAGLPGLVLAAVALIAALAPWLAPRDPDLQEDVAGATSLPPLARAHALQLGPHRLRIVTALRSLDGGWEYRRAGRTESVLSTELLAPPSPRFYLLGTDTLGRDLASRVLFGTRHSLAVASLSMLMALTIAVSVGSTAALAGGLWDALLMRGVDAFISIPRVLLFLVCATLLRPSTLLLVLVLGATTWTGLARIVRVELMALRSGDVAMAARAMGSSPARIALRHLLPQMGPLLAVAASLRFADILLLESALAFLGLSSPPPAVSLGSIIASGREAPVEAWWVIVFPGLLISAAVLVLRSSTVKLLRLPDPPSLA